MQERTIRIELGDGKWADVKDVSELRDGHRVAVKASYKLEVEPGTNKVTVPGNRDDLMRRALLGLIITAWNLQYPLPSRSPGSLDELTFAQAKALRKGTEEHFKLVTADENEESDPTDEPGSGSSEIS